MSRFNLNNAKSAANPAFSWMHILAASMQLSDGCGPSRLCCIALSNSVYINVMRALFRAYLLAKTCCFGQRPSFMQLRSPWVCICQLRMPRLTLVSMHDCPGRLSAQPRNAYLLLPRASESTMSRSKKASIWALDSCLCCGCSARRASSYLVRRFSKSSLVKLMKRLEVSVLHISLLIQPAVCLTKSMPLQT